MAQTLTFALYGRKAGTLTLEAGRLALTYDRAYAADPAATPLSLSLPLNAPVHRHRTIQAYLQGLLPDRVEVLERWAVQAGVGPNDTFGLIGALGLDLAGGAIFTSDDALDEALTRPGTLTPVGAGEIGARLRALRTDPNRWHDSDGEHWSLAGGQSKFTLARTDSGWAWPGGAVPSTHIVKPGIGHLPAQALSEHVSMRTLALAGLPVAESQFEQFGEESAIVVARFDRTRADDGRILRLHSEDLVQAFGIDPVRKYEGRKGPGIAEIASLIDRWATKTDVEVFARAVIGNYLIGAPDAHAKNYSLLLVGGTVALAPLYDVASGLAITTPDGRLRYDRSAMSIGGQNHIGQVTGANWDRFAGACGLDQDQIRTWVTELAIQIPEAMADAVNALPHDLPGREVLTGQVLPRVAALSRHTITDLDSTPEQWRHRRSSSTTIGLTQAGAVTPPSK